MANVRTKTLSVALIVLLGLSILPITGALPVVNADGATNVVKGKALAARLMIDRVRTLIERIEALSPEYNVALDENMTNRLDLAKELLENATAIVDEDPDEALRLALNASRLVMPVYVYVIKSLPPGAKDELAARRVTAMIEARERMLANLEIRLGWLENRSVEIPDEVWDALNQAKQYLENAKAIIESGGNLTEARQMIRQADTEIKRITLTIKENLRHLWRMAVVGDAGIKYLITAVAKLARATNATLTLIEENRTDKAIQVLNSVVNVSTRIITGIEGIEGKLNITNDNITTILSDTKTIAEIIKESATEAIAALEAGDTTTAVSIIEDAMDQVKPLLEELIGLARWAHTRLKWIQQAMEHVRERATEHMEHMIRKFAMRMETTVIMMKVSFQKLKNAFHNGRISCETYTNILKHMQDVLSRMKDRAGKMPHIVQESIDNLLQEINNELSQLVCTQ